MTTKYVEELPPSGKGKYQRPPQPEHVKMVRKLKRRPEEWYPVREFQTPQSASTFARKIRESRFIAFRDGLYEASSRDCVVYARYLRDRRGKEKLV